jgi:ABC-type multidrug transport system fused ATPase/permease subunit
VVQRFFSSRIGEGIIYDLRTRCTTTCSGMPLQFFTRTQTGALVSRLNNDVIGAQQAFTSTLSGTVGNVIALLLTAGVMFTLSWQVTAAVAGAGAGVHAAAGWSGAGWPRSPGVVPARREDERHHDRAVRRGRALLVKLFGRPTSRPSGSPAGPPGSATSACSRPCTAPLLRRHDARRLAGAGAHLRAGRLARGHGTITPAPW